VQAGHRALLSNGYYLDFGQPAEKHYMVDPLAGDAANLSPEQQKMILGGESCMWSERVTAENVDSRIWPRNAAIAERLWSPADVRDVNSMYQRLENVSQRLDTLGLTHHSALRVMQERLAPEHLDALRTLGEIVEPVKGYARLRGSTSDTPLNRLPDSVPPESLAARKFSAVVDRIVAGNATNEDLTSARELMTAWKENNERLSPALQTSQPLAEDGPVSQNLASVGTVGLQALDIITSHSPAQAGWADQTIAHLEAMKKPQAELLLMAVPPIEKLVQAVGK
jgi:hexosaminidase